MYHRIVLLACLVLAFPSTAAALANSSILYSYCCGPSDTLFEYDQDSGVSSTVFRPAPNNSITVLAVDRNRDILFSHGGSSDTLLRYDPVTETTATVFRPSPNEQLSVLAVDLNGDILFSYCCGPSDTLFRYDPGTGATSTIFQPSPNESISVLAVVPEPGTAGLFALAVIFLGSACRLLL